MPKAPSSTKEAKVPKEPTKRAAKKEKGALRFHRRSLACPSPFPVPGLLFPFAGMGFLQMSKMIWGSLPPLLSAVITVLDTFSIKFPCFSPGTLVRV